MSHPWTVRAVRYATRVTPKSAVFYDYATFGGGTGEAIRLDDEALGLDKL